MERFDWIVVTQDTPEQWLAQLEAALPPVADMEDEQVKQWKRMSSLYMRKRHGVKMRLLYTLSRIVSPREEATRRCYRRHLTASRAGRILLALRRHKNTARVWPADLSEIEAGLPREAFVDPLSGRRLIYRRTEDSFCLYSPGPNGVDEGGTSGDDHPLWPR